MTCGKQSAQEPCVNQIDYSRIPGEEGRFLPFVITLNQQTSVLNPSVGQNQKFCYDITAVGQDNSTFADLSHSVFSICNEIPEDQIKNITVKINGVDQTVTFPGNVELRTPENPDPPTGCPGLKFDFPLDKVDGVMNLCFELTIPRVVGPNEVCLFGGNNTVKGLFICGPTCETMNPCPEPCPADCTTDCCTVRAHQEADLCVPIAVFPCANVGTPITKCCGEPTITKNGSCPSRSNCPCTFTIMQTVCVEVPVTFGARAMPGPVHVMCGEPAEGDCPENCGTSTRGEDEDK